MTHVAHNQNINFIQIIDVENKDLDSLLISKDYKHSIYKHYKDRQLDFQISHIKSPEICKRHRNVLLDWLLSIIKKDKYDFTIYYLTVYLLDLVLSKSCVSLAKFQLLGSACYWIAQKYHAVYFSDARDLVYYSDHAFSTRDLKAEEQRVLGILNFEIFLPQLDHFLMYYIYDYKLPPREQIIINYFALLSTFNHDLQRCYKNNEIALACIDLTNKLLNKQDFVFVHIPSYDCNKALLKFIKSYMNTVTVPDSLKNISIIFDTYLNDINYMNNTAKVKEDNQKRDIQPLHEFIKERVKLL